MPVGRNARAGRSCANAGEAAITSRACTSCRLVKLPRSNWLTRVSIVWFITSPPGLPLLRRVLHQEPSPEFLYLDVAVPSRHSPSRLASDWPISFGFCSEYSRREELTSHQFPSLAQACSSNSVRYFGASAA